MGLHIIDIAGLKKSGKTTIVEDLVHELSSRGYKVGTVKKIHIPGFTIDQKGKDTYRHKQAGAEFVISLAPEEIALIKELHGQRELAEIIDLIPKETDFLICEELNENHKDILYIIALQELDQLKETLSVRTVGEKILAISGVVSSNSEEHDKYPIFNTRINEGRKKLVDLILDNI